MVEEKERTKDSTKISISRISPDYLSLEVILGGYEISLSKSIGETTNREPPKHNVTWTTRHPPSDTHPPWDSRPPSPFTPPLYPQWGPSDLIATSVSLEFEK